MSVPFEVLLPRLAPNGEIVHLERLAARPARFGELRTPLPTALAERVPSRLYSHQATAIDLAMSGGSLAVATGTASGKSLCYQVPIAAAAMETSGRATSILLFPTKALAQDQLRSFGAMSIPGLTPVTYDGDTSADARAWARRHATAVFTNPDMLHAGILPYHGRWATFLRRLRFVVVDELHTYRGIFGTHVAHVLRRLRRVCAMYGATPTFVFASATIGDPAGLAQSLCGLPVTAVDDDGSPQGERLVAVWRSVPRADGVPVSGNAASAQLLAGLAAAGHRTIAFTRSRHAAELVSARAKRLAADTPGLDGRIRSYRGGYLPAERREIEAQLFDGRLLGVSATNALELGVDIGGLDACVINGFPGTIASFRQQIGRAGRSAQRSLAVLVVGDDALDQWYAAHPAELTARAPEPSVVNIANPFVLIPHVACAAHEVPLTPGDAEVWCDSSTEEAFDDAVRDLVRHDDLVLINGRAVWSGSGTPAPSVSLRNGGGAEFRIVDARADGRLLGTVDGSRALSTVHEGALYLHQGQQYRVVELDLDDRVAWVESTDVDEYTQVRSQSDIRILDAERTISVGRLTLRLGRVQLDEQVVGYQRKRISTGAVLALEPLTLPPSRLVTRAFWYEVPDAVVEQAELSPLDVAGTVHAAEHAGIGMLPLFTICDRWDVGGVSTAIHAQTELATIFIYDGYPGGAGIAELGFASGRRHLDETLGAIRRCRCAAGCPSCVQSPKCGNGNDPLDKAGAIALLEVGLRDLPPGGRGPRQPLASTMARISSAV